MGRLAIAVAVAALVLTAATSSTASTEADFAALAYVRGGEIHLTRPAAASHQLTRGDGDVEDLAWSPDGGTIAFIRVYEGPSYSGPQPSVIFAIAPDGKRLRRLTARLPDLTFPVWSPDGKSLAFLERRGGDFDLRVRTSGGELRDVATRVDVAAPSWSPDGRRLAWSARNSTSFSAPSSIFVASIDRTTPRQLTRGTGHGDTWPLWSPAGSHILFQRGSTLRLLDPRSGRVGRSLGAGYDSAWSPDGLTIAFRRLGDVWAMDSEGGHERKLARNTYGPFPAWSPDGRKIAFVRAKAIFVMNSDGSGQRRVAVDATSFAWRPGRR